MPTKSLWIIWTIVLFSLILILLEFLYTNRDTATASFSQIVYNNNTSSFGLCVFILATFFDKQHKDETLELMELYSGRKEVFFFMDILSNIYDDTKTCNEHDVQCIFISWDRSINGKNLTRNRFISLVTRKTEAVFQYIISHEIHKQCKFMIKLDCDAYVNIDYYSYWLNLNLNYLDDLYVGQAMTCPGKPHKIWMIQGTYTLSQGIFINHPSLTFKGNTSLLSIPRPALQTDLDDCSIGYVMTYILHVDMIDTTPYVFFKNQTMLHHIWEHKMNDKQRICKWMCHRCSSRLRRHFALESEWLHKHQSMQHCLKKGYGRMQYEPRVNKSYRYNRSYAYPKVSCNNKIVSFPLSFIHIPKTGGSTIISLAKNKTNICWGRHMSGSIPNHRNISFNICHRFAICKQPTQRFVGYPSINSLPSLWHIPLRYTLKYIDEMKSTPDWKWYFARDEYDYFCVVRNPLMKILSEFKWSLPWSWRWLNRKEWNTQFGYRSDVKRSWCSKEALNYWIVNMIEETMNNNYCFGDCHFIPQNEYVFDENGNQICSKILRFENLNKEFDELMKHYQLQNVLNIKEYKQQMISRNCKQLTVDDISNETKKLIYKMYEKDFKSFNYTMYS